MGLRSLCGLHPRLDLAPPPIGVGSGASYLIIRLVVISASLEISFL